MRTNAFAEGKSVGASQAEARDYPESPAPRQKAARSTTGNSNGSAACVLETTHT
jgi:hypothetical protein